MTYKIKPPNKLKGLVMLQQALSEYLKLEQYDFNINKSKVYKVIEISVFDKANNNEIVKSFIIKYNDFNDFYNTLQKLNNIIENKLSSLVLRKLKKVSKKNYIIEIFENDTLKNRIKYIKERTLERYIKSKTSNLSLKDQYDIIIRMYNVITRGYSSVNVRKKGILSTCENINLDYFLNEFIDDFNNEALKEELNNPELSNFLKLEIIKTYFEKEIRK